MSAACYPQSISLDSVRYFAFGLGKSGKYKKKVGVSFFLVVFLVVVVILRAAKFFVTLFSFAHDHLCVCVR